MQRENKRRRLDDTVVGMMLDTADIPSSCAYHALKRVIESNRSTDSNLEKITYGCISALLDAGVAPMAIGEVIQEACPTEYFQKPMLTCEQPNAIEEDIYKQVDMPTTTQLEYRGMQESARVRMAVDVLLGEEEKLRAKIQQTQEHTAILNDQQDAINHDIVALRALFCNADR